MAKFGGKASGGNGIGYEVPEADSHVAVVVALIDLGTQREIYQGETTQRRKVYLAYELVGATNQRGDNFVVGHALTYSTNEKATLRAIAEKVLRKNYTNDRDDIVYDDLLGKPCLVTIEHVQKNGKTYYKIKDVSGVPKVVGKVSPHTHKPILWSFDDYDVVGLQPITDAKWLPYLYGRPLDQVIEEAIDFPGRAGEIEDETESRPTHDDPF